MSALTAFDVQGKLTAGEEFTQVVLGHAEGLNSRLAGTRIRCALEQGPVSYPHRPATGQEEMAEPLADSPEEMTASCELGAAFGDDQVASRHFLCLPVDFE